MMDSWLRCLSLASFICCLNQNSDASGVRSRLIHHSLGAWAPPSHLSLWYLDFHGSAILRLPWVDLPEQHFVSSVDKLQHVAPPSSRAPSKPPPGQTQSPFCLRLHILPPTLMFPGPVFMMSSVYRGQTLFSLLRRTGWAVWFVYPFRPVVEGDLLREPSCNFLRHPGRPWLDFDVVLARFARRMGLTLKLSLAAWAMGPPGMEIQEITDLLSDDLHCLFGELVLGCFCQANVPVLNSWDLGSRYQ